MAEEPAKGATGDLAMTPVAIREGDGAHPAAGQHNEVGVAHAAPSPNVAGLDATWFVAAAMVAVIALMLWKKVPALLGRGLDAKIAAIRDQLDEAKRLRAEAEALKAEYQAKAASAEADAAAMRSHAERDAAAIVADAEAEAQRLVARRTAMSEARIGAAERAALADIRAHAASAASKAAEAVITRQHNAHADARLVDEAIAAL